MPDETPRILDLLRRADAAYKSFPPLSKWSGLSVSSREWEDAATALPRPTQVDAEQLRRARGVAKRAAAVDTGAIEGLYEVDRGFTITIATEAAMWENLLREKGDRARALIEAQLDAYDYVMDFATQRLPVAEAWIRSLHEKLCAPQDTYLVYTEVGPQEQPLPKGTYKVHPNHVQIEDGKVHSYAPVDMTAPEMHRLCEELRSEPFSDAHPVIQAAYAHYAFVVIHPFADGNGRVARALGSVYTYRANSIPLLILMEHRNAYLRALRAADGGNLQPFVDFVARRGVEAMALVAQSFATAHWPRPSDALDALGILYAPKRGLTHEGLDEIAAALTTAVHDGLLKCVKGLPALPYITLGVAREGWGRGAQNPGFRLRMTVQESVRLSGTTQPPNASQAQVSFVVEIPRDAERTPFFVVRRHPDSGGTEESLLVNVSDLAGGVTTTVQLRAAMWAEGEVGRLLKDLDDRANAAAGGRT